MNPRLVLAISVCLIALFTSPVAAHPSDGEYLDTTCTANEWVPMRPFNPDGADPTDPTQVDCGLCHTNAMAPTAALTESGQQYADSGHTDVTPFCSPSTNRAPRFIEVGPQTLLVGVPFVLNVTATDPDMDMMVLTVANAPAGSTFQDRGAGRGRFLWTPVESDAGSHTVTFHVADTGIPVKVGSMEVPFAVGSGVNHPPVLAPIGDQTVEVGAELALSLSATDEDGDALVFEAPGLPSGASLTGSEFRFTPSASQVGTHSLTFAVVDNGSPPEADSETISVTVGEANRPPVLAPIGNRSAMVGTQMEIAVTASDPDGDPLTLDCAGLPSDASFTDRQDGTGAIDWSPSAVGSALVTCSAADDALPPMTVGEVFTMTATEPPVTGPKAVLDAARWIAHARKLEVRGHWEGAGDRTPVAIYGVAPGGEAYLLGTRETHRDGFEIRIRAFVAPCQVAAGVDEPAIAVTGAPSDCGQRLLTHARARLSCGGGELHVAGWRGPVGGEVVFVDPANGAELARMPADHRGRFRFHGVVGKVPRALQLRAESAGMSWVRKERVEVYKNSCRSHRHGHHGHW